MGSTSAQNLLSLQVWSSSEEEQKDRDSSVKQPMKPINVILFFHVGLDAAVIICRQERPMVREFDYMPERFEGLRPNSNSLPRGILEQEA